MKKSLVSRLYFLVLPLIFSNCSSNLKITPYEKYDSNKLVKKEAYQDSTKLFKYEQKSNKNFQEQIGFYLTKK